MKTYSKLQILKAGKTLVDSLEVDEYDIGYVDMVNHVVQDLINILEGKLKPPPVAKEVIIFPSGFLPVLGEIVADEKLGNRIEFYTEGD